jgi:hypothetical protein
MPLLLVHNVIAVLRYQSRRTFRVITFEHMMKRFLDEAVFIKPGAGSPVEIGDIIRAEHAFQLILQKSLKQVVITEPPSLVVQDSHK